MHVQMYISANIDVSKELYVLLNFDPDKIFITGYDFSWSFCGWGELQ